MLRNRRRSLQRTERSGDRLLRRLLFLRSQLSTSRPADRDEARRVLLLGTGPGHSRLDDLLQAERRFALGRRPHALRGRQPWADDLAVRRDGPRSPRGRAIVDRPPRRQSRRTDTRRTRQSLRLLRQSRAKNLRPRRPPHRPDQRPRRQLHFRRPDFRTLCIASADKFLGLRTNVTGLKPGASRAAETGVLGDTFTAPKRY